MKPRIHTYTHTQPLDTRSTTTAPKRGCMRVAPTVVDSANAVTFTGIYANAFRSLLPQGRPRATPCSPTEYHVFTISNASTGPHGGVLFRVDATVHGHPARCLIDCGASSDFISTDFVKRHGLEQRMLATQHRVRGYDGQLTPAAGVLESPVTLTSLGKAKDAAPLRLLAAQLHSDDVILGLPWLTATGAIIDFAARSVALDHAGTRCTVLLAQAPRTTPAADGAPTASSRLMEAVLDLYSTDVDDDSVGPSDLAALLRGNDTIAAMLRDTDDRGSMRPIQPRKPPPAVATDPALGVMRKKLLAEFADVFPDKLPPGLPPSRGHELHIELRPDARPPHRQPLRQNQKHAAFEAKWIKDMLANGHIKNSQSEYAAPHFYVPKPDSATTGEYRAVTDYRQLNAQTVKNRYPLPRADQLFDKLAHAKYFSKIDLRTGFYQILIAEKDRHKTAFSTSQGLFEYTVLPMGLCNSPGVFMALMNDTFRAYLDQFVLVFLDDIIVYSDTLEDHERHLRLALQRLREQRLCAKLSKSALCQTEVEFLGHYVGRDGLRVMEDKIDTVRDWPVPTTIRELRAFLGLAGYYRRFVKGFSGIALPLTELTRNVTHQRLQWGSRQQLAFIELKRALQSTPVLALPDPALPFVVNCDASGYAVGAVLQQDRGSGLQPIAFMSKKLTGAESRYPVHEQELLAIITALTTWRHYLSGTSTPVRVRTDHKSLIHFQTQPMLSGRQTRWLETLADYDYTIEYVKGEDNEVADALSRRGDLNDGAAERPPAFVDTKRSFMLNHIMTRTERTPLIDEISAIQRAERHGRAAVRDVIDLTSVGSTTFSSELAAEFDAACVADAVYAARLARGDGVDRDELITRDGRLFTRSTGALYVPQGDALRTRLIRECHDSATAGHLGRDKTVEQMQRRFFWHGMTTRVGEYVTTCDACQRNKPSQRSTPGLLMPIASPTCAGHTWTMDLITGLPKSRSGNDAIVVWVCKFSKLRHYAACKTAISAPQLARLFVQTIVRLHGMPERVISDRDPRFTAHFWRAFWSTLGSTLDMGAAYHPESDGQTENANKTLEIMLRSVVDFKQDDWDEHLAAAELAFNCSKNATTGFTPFYLVYGREARMPLDLALAPLTKAADNPAAAEATARWRSALQHASDNTAQQQKRQKRYADRARRDIRFVVGDRVLLSTEHLALIGERRRTRKLTERFIGPYRVKRVVNANAYELELPASLKIHPVINIGHLKEYHDGVRAFPDRPVRLTRPEPEAIDDNGAPEWLVDRLLDHRKVKRGTRHIDQYLVEWKGYPISEATWEPIENLTGSMDLVKEFNEQRNVQLSAVVTILRQTFAQVAKSVSHRRAQPELTAVLRGRSTGFQRRGGCNRAAQEQQSSAGANRHNHVKLRGCRGSGGM